MDPVHRSEILIPLSSLEDLAIALDVDLAVDAFGAIARCWRDDVVLLLGRHVGGGRQ